MRTKKPADTSLIRLISERVDGTTSIENLYECFVKHRQQLIDDEVAGLFLKRIDFFRNRAMSGYDIEKCDELLLDIETERSVISPTLAARVGEPTLTMTVSLKSGCVYDNCIEQIIKVAIDKVGPQRASLSKFLGVNIAVIIDACNRNRALKLYWDEAKRKNKKLDE